MNIYMHIMHVPTKCMLHKYRKNNIALTQVTG